MEVVAGLFVPNSVTILGVTGQAGAGKTQFITPLIKAVAAEHSFPCSSLGLDAFFRLSSLGRKKWIADGAEMGPAEHAYRKNQINWWNFESAQKSLLSLKRGEVLHLTNAYNRQDGGELTGEVLIEPPREGLLVIFEGVAIAHLDGADELMYVHAPSHVRFERLYRRDASRRKSIEEARDRFHLTQDFERHYFPQHWERISCFIDNSAEVPQVLGTIPHEIALT